MGKITIFGAGLSGLICGCAFKDHIILEASKELPHNHGAVLRFKTDAVAKLVDIPFREVAVSKAIWLKDQEVVATPRTNNMYSIKVLGSVASRSIMDLSPSLRFIAPLDFVEQLAKKCNIEYDQQVLGVDENTIRTRYSTNIRDKSEPIISTLPMPMLAQIIGEKFPEPDYSPVYTAVIEIHGSDAFSTIYYPGPETWVYRASLQGSQLLIESTSPIHSFDIETVFRSFGLDGLKEWQIGPINNGPPGKKIRDLPSDLRRSFIYRQSVNLGIYSLGRLATWRTKLMLDDLVDDIEVIKRIIRDGEYSAACHNQEEV